MEGRSSRSRCRSCWIMTARVPSDSEDKLHYDVHRRSLTTAGDGRLLPLPQKCKGNATGIEESEQLALAEGRWAFYWLLWR